MYPWLWLWAPQFHWNTSQDVEPVTDWDFASVPSDAGDPRIEKQAVRVASYGKQLGLITEVLLARAGSSLIDGETAADSLARLERIYERIEAVKKSVRMQSGEALAEQLESLKGADRDAFDYVMNRLGVALPA
jgi:hypothetical protein